MLRVLSLATLCLASVVSVYGQPPLTNRDVIQMLERGISREEVIKAIKAAPTVNFTFTPFDFAEMRRVAAGPDVYGAMSDRQTLQERVDRGAGSPRPTLTPSSQPAENEDRPLRAGADEVRLSAAIAVPHIAAEATSAQVDLGYQRYLTPRLSIGTSVNAIFFSSSIHAIAGFGLVQFSQPVAPRVYWVVGGGPGLASVRAGDTSNRFAATAYTGPRIFANKNVAFDIRYGLGFVHQEAGTFRSMTSSNVTAGFSVFF